MHHAAFRGRTRLGRLDPSRPIEVTFLCRRNPEHDHESLLRGIETEAFYARRRWSGAEFERVFGAHPTELARVTRFAEERRMTVKRFDARTRLVVAEADAGALARAFDVELGLFDYDGQTRRGHDTPVGLPASLREIVEAVAGLDDLPVVRARPLAPAARTRGRIALEPSEIRSYYEFPKETGAGEILALLEMSGGFSRSDLASYFKSARVRPPSVRTAGQNRPASLASLRSLVGWINGTSGPPPEAELAQARWSYETTMDIELAGVLAPEAKLVVGFAASNDASGALKAMRTLIHRRPRPTVLSLSWALGRVDGSKLDALLDDCLQEAMVLGITTSCASGDFGSRGDAAAKGASLSLDYPAASRFVLSCGGTSLTRRGDGFRERVWRAKTSGLDFASGGGLDRGAGATPAWQRQALSAWSRKQNGPKVSVSSISRGVPDVAASADFASGCRLLVGGLETTAGGTSASAPTWAALVACINSALLAGQGNGKRLGFVSPTLYDAACAKTFRSIGTGDNNLSDPRGRYRAVPGVWDPCTGLGTPRGQKLLSALEAMARKGD